LSRNGHFAWQLNRFYAACYDIPVSKDTGEKQMVTVMKIFFCKVFGHGR